MNNEYQVLDGLPEVKFFAACANCGALDWTQAGMSADNRVVVRCSECPDNPTDWSALEKDGEKCL